MPDPKVSVVMPVYNAAKYLPRSIEALQRQTLSDLEFILVNDGSVDGSADVIRRLTAGDERFHLVEQQNLGTSRARNCGLRLARGEYIGFADADDWVEPTLFERLYETAKAEDADIVSCSYIREFESGKSLPKELGLPPKAVFDRPQEFMRISIGPVGEESKSPEIRDSHGTLWNKIYRREIIMDNHLSFVDMSVVQAEDVLFNIEAAYYARRVVYLSEHLVHYWKANETSLTSTYNVHLSEQWGRLYRHIDNLIRNLALPPEFAEALKNRRCSGCIMEVLNEAAAPVDFEKRLKRVRRILKRSDTREAFCGFRAGATPFPYKLIYFTIRHRMSFLALLEAEGILLLRARRNKAK